MKSLRSCVLLLAFTACHSEPAPSPSPPPSTVEHHMVIKRAGSQPAVKGAVANFVGDVLVTPLFAPTDQTHTSGGSVTFQPGARSAWHTHPAGQILIITAGTGWTQEWGQPKQELHAGDVVWTPAGVKHWHGATSTTSMTHIAIQDQVDGKAVAWDEPATDDEYRQ